MRVEEMGGSGGVLGVRRAVLYPGAAPRPPFGLASASIQLSQSAVLALQAAAWAGPNVPEPRGTGHSPSSPHQLRPLGAIVRCRAACPGAGRCCRVRGRVWRLSTGSPRLSSPPSLCAALLYALQFQPPFAGMDPVEAARQAALYERRPEFVALMQPHPMKKVGTLAAACSLVRVYVRVCACACVWWWWSERARGQGRGWGGRTAQAGQSRPSAQSGRQRGTRGAAQRWLACRGRPSNAHLLAPPPLVPARRRCAS